MPKVRNVISLKMLLYFYICRYRIYLKSLGSPVYRKRTLHKRYYVKNKKDKIECGDWNDTKQLSEEEFTIKNRSYNKRLGEHPGDVDLWLEFVQHQNYTYMKSTKLQIVERKLDILDKALRENPSNEQLYNLYVNIIEQAYPSFEVSKILDKLLLKGNCVLPYKVFSDLKFSIHFV